jgi:lon-related putative ATP-dependent protease
MEPGQPLPAEALYRSCDPGDLDFETTAELETLRHMVGQERAVEAIRFGAGMEVDGFNLFVLGPAGTCRHSFIRQFLAQRAAGQVPASDWCYVNNFAQPQKPTALELPAGLGRRLCDDVDRLLKEAHTAIPAAFESDDYRTRRQSIEEEFKEQQSKAFEAIQQHAKERGIQIIQTPTGIAFAPVRRGEVLSPDDFEKLPEHEQQRVQHDIEEVSKEFRKAMEETPKRVRRAHDKIRELDREFAVYAVGSLIDDLIRRYEELPKVVEHLKRMQIDIIDNVDQFRSSPEQQPQHILRRLGGTSSDGADQSTTERRYGVNLLVDNTQSEGAPVVFEDHPAHPYLIGRIEHLAQMGALVTDFSLLRAGALHRANGGYLVLDARKVLTEPFAWEALKQALKARHIRIESLGQAYSLVSTVSLEPEPIPLRVKVVLIGERLLYYLLQALDPEFSDLFKVAADFEDQMERTPENHRLFAQLIGTIAARENLKALDRAAVARIIEESARHAGDSQRLSTQVRRAADIVREASYWASEDGNEVVRLDDVQRAIDSREHRASRVRERLREEILRNTILIDSDGAKVGQINGLAVSQIGDFAFARPSRITARLSLGSGKVIDIEREVELGGPLHSKGVLILSGFLASQFVTDRPLSLAATLVFEQSYGGIEGDSASSAELYALLSALAEVPIKQSLAVTGSVNQYGEIQAIGAVNEKIEGFYDVCAARGLTGEQGVLIPMANVQHLMLRRKVIDAVAQGRFHVYPVRTVDQGMEILTGVAAGTRDTRGEFPEDTLNHRVRARLIELAEQRRAFGAEIKREDKS